MPSARPVAVIVLAAGEGTRMKSATPKVLHRLGGRSILGHVLHVVRTLEPEDVLVVVGHGRDAVTAAMAEMDPLAKPVVQEEQRGTGHAVRIAMESISPVEGTVVVVPGDHPLFTPETFAALVEAHEASGAATTLLSAVFDDATGYGRVVRDGDQVLKVVEHKDADEATRQIREVATSVYAFSAGPLREALGRLTTDNAQGEEYLPDVVAIHRDAGLGVGAHVVGDAREAAGVNDRAQLAAAARELRDRVNRAHMRAGVAILDPQTTWIDADVVIEPDATIAQNTQIKGASLVRRNATVGPDSTVTDCEVGEGASLVRTQATGAVIGKGATVGPFSFLRPGTVLGEGAKVGAYVEVKASEIGAGSKVPHLSYVGDTVVGERSNIGAGTIVVNYDGVAKHRTTVGDDVRIGSNNSLVAPVTVNDGAYTAAGSAITMDVPPGALGVGREKQRNIEGWVARKRPPKGES